MVSPYKTGWCTYRRCEYYKRRAVEEGVGLLMLEKCNIDLSPKNIIANTLVTLAETIINAGSY